jgi:hypothetical protein
MKNTLRIILLVMSMAWTLPMAMAINLLYSHYTHNVLQTKIVHSFPFLHYGMELLIISSAWMAISGFVVISYVLTWGFSRKWPYPFSE